VTSIHINKGEFMENTKKPQEQTSTGTGNQATAVKAAEDKTQHNQQSKANGESNFASGATEVVDQAKQAVTDVYNRASKGLNESYTQAIDYGRENPGKTTLIAFGAGIGIGLLLAGSMSSSRNSRTGRIVPPVMNALTEIAREVFR
jgi:ElaB/YqjD/DUF883 family membrane-anchored ribosome-binding protein